VQNGAKSATVGRWNSEMLGFCEGVQSTAEGQLGVLNIMLVSDEAHLHLDDHINKQNCHPQKFQGLPL
jgi:hypothetical protein